MVVADEVLPLASFGRRFSALLIDWLIVAAVYYVALIAVFIVAVAVAVGPDTTDGGPNLSQRAFYSAIMAFGLAVMGVQWAFDSFGWSPGKAATSVRVVRLDGKRPGIVHGLVRYCMRTVSVVCLGLGFFWALWDRRNQTWHDKLAATVVVQARAVSNGQDRRPEPLVTRPSIWGLAVLSTVILTASVAVNVWWVVSAEGEVFEPDYWEPYRFEDDQRIQQFARADGLELSVAPFEG